MAPTSVIPETLLIKEVLHCCQGIDGGRYIWLQGNGDSQSQFACGPGVEVTCAQRQLISRITELGWLLRKVNELIRKATELKSDVHEALVSATNKEVNNCYRLIAILEAQSQQQQTGQQQLQNQAAEPTVGGQLTLRRIVVWLSEPQQRLRVLASCLEAAVPLRGGQAINALHAMSKHGDSLVRRVVSPVLEEACDPYFKRVARWVLDGTLDADSADDFMIVAQPLANDNPAAIWRHGHALNSSMKPRFVSSTLSDEILTAGKTVHFLRGMCGDSEWAEVMAGASVPEMDTSQGGTFQRPLWLQEATSDVRRSVGGRLLDVVMHRERLASHLAAVRRYILLSQGDFVRSLLDLAGPELDQGARSVSTYALQGHVETALRSCGSATQDADLLPRVQVRIQRPLEGDSGWDVFGLSYIIDGPAAVVLSPEAMATYGRVSRLLWAVKQVDHVVALSWHLLDNTSHSLATLRALHTKYGVDIAGVADGVAPLLRYLHARRADVAQFVSTLQAHLVYDVLEPAWAKLTAALSESTDLNGIISAHEEALADITSGTFLDNARAPSPSVGDASVSNSASDVQAALRAALRSVLDIAGPIHRLFSATEAAVSEQQAYLKRVAESEASGEWTDEVYNSPPGVSQVLLAEVRSGVWRVHSAFDRHLRTFLALLPPQSHLDLRSLASRLEAGDFDTALVRNA